MANTKKAVVRRRPRKATVPRGVKSKTFAMKRSVQSVRLSSAGSTAIYSYGSMAFTLNSLPNYAEFTSLFDQYRIKKVSVLCIPRETEQVDTGTATANVFSYCIDHTDVTAPTAETDILQYDNHKTLQAFKPFNITFTPQAATTVWQGTASSGYAPAKAASWIDSKSYAVQHYGVKWCWCNNNSVTNIIDCYATYWVEFREPM